VVEDADRNGREDVSELRYTVLDNLTLRLLAYCHSSCHRKCQHGVDIY
jgi:hypothetical protein